VQGNSRNDYVRGFKAQINTSSFNSLSAFSTFLCADSFSYTQIDLCKIIEYHFRFYIGNVSVVTASASLVAVAALMLPMPACNFSI
jgi:hypothetical protein